MQRKKQHTLTIKQTKTIKQPKIKKTNKPTENKHKQTLPTKEEKTQK